MLTFDQLDLDNLALVAWKEARGDGNDAMLAIMHICLNRISYPGFPTALHEVIYQKNAFTSTHCKASTLAYAHCGTRVARTALR